MTAISFQNNVMLMGLSTMSETNSEIELEPAMATNNKSVGQASSDIDISESYLNDANNGVIKNGKGKFNSTYVKPLVFAMGIVTLGVGVFSVKALTPEPVVSTIDGGEVNAVKVDKEKNGRDQLTTEQAKYLSDKDLMEAQQKAAEGATTAALINRAEVSSKGTYYEDTTSTNLDAINKDYQNIPKTTAQLIAENDAANGLLYSMGMDGDGNVIFTHKRSGALITPIDKVNYDALKNGNGKVNPNATYSYSSNNYNSNSQGGNSNPNSQGSGSNQPNNTNAVANDDGNDERGNNQANNNVQQSQEPQLDPVIESKRLTLGSDYEQFLAQNEELAAKEQQLREQQNARYEELRNFRYDAANNSLNQTLNDIRASVGSVNAYTPMSYTRTNGNNSNNGNGYNGNGNNNNGYNGNNNNGNNGNNNGYGTGFNGGSISLPPNGFNDKTDVVTVANRGEYQKNDTYSVGGSASSANGSMNGQEQGEILDNRLPKNVIRAGTKWQAVITNQVNSDEGLQVTGELVTGKFAGSKVYGIIQPSGRNIGIQWQTIAPPNPRKPLIPISAYATTLATDKTAVSTDVTYHYGQNYGIKALTSIIKGYGDAYEGSNQTVTYGPDGNITSISGNKPDSDEIRGEVLSELGDELTKDIAKLGNRPPTYKVPMGKIVNIVLAQDFDVNQTTSSIGNVSQSNNFRNN